MPRDRNQIIFLLTVSALLFVGSSTAFAVKAEESGLIDFGHRDSLESREPILIAHRGGVITATAPECSLAAIRLAAADGYDMVELDIQMTADGHAVLFHDKELERDTGRKGRIADYSQQDLIQVSYLNTAEKIASLEEALKLCRELNLGVMLDFKTEGTQLYYERILEELDRHHLRSSTVTISSKESVRKFFQGKILLRIIEDDSSSAKGSYVFDRASFFTPEAVLRFRQRGLLLLPALNTFHYPEKENLAAAQADARRLLDMGVDGFQIDSVYQHFFGLPKRIAAD